MWPRRRVGIQTSQLTFTHFVPVQCTLVFNLAQHLSLTHRHICGDTRCRVKKETQSLDHHVIRHGSGATQSHGRSGEKPDGQECGQSAACPPGTHQGADCGNPSAGNRDKIVEAAQHVPQDGNQGRIVQQVGGFSVERIKERTAEQIVDVPVEETRLALT